MIQQKCGKIELIFGPMFSGKTSELLRRERIYKIIGVSTVIVKFLNDVRYNCNLDEVITHDGVKINAIVTKRISDVMTKIMKYDCILIDEGQFFEDICETSDMLANIGKIVIISALNGTFLRKRFINMSNLTSIADDITFLKSICEKCKNYASFTHRIDTTNQNEIEIGDKKIYVSLCRTCYNKDNDTHANKML